MRDAFLQQNKRNAQLISSVRQEYCSDAPDGWEKTALARWPSLDDASLLKAAA
jgi:hypothetical protein